MTYDMNSVIHSGNGIANLLVLSSYIVAIGNPGNEFKIGFRKGLLFHPRSTYATVTV